MSKEEVCKNAALKKLASDHLDNYTKTRKEIPVWVYNLSIGKNYERGLTQDEIIAFVAGFCAGFNFESFDASEDEVDGMEYSIFFNAQYGVMGDQPGSIFKSDMWMTAREAHRIYRSLPEVVSKLCHVRYRIKEK